jgi:hypothetical protein
LEVLVMSEGYELTEEDLALSEEEVAYWAAEADAEEFAARDWRRLQRFEELLCHGRFFRARLLRWWTLRCRRQWRRRGVVR